MVNLDFDIEKRAELAVGNFHEGYNCAQSVFLAYSDVIGLDFETAKCISVSLGGGMGRMREVCGTVSAMSILAGFRYPVADPADQKARARNYAMVQKMATCFKEKFKSIICRELLPAEDAAKKEPAPSLRTSAYYAKRPCGKYIAEAARITGSMLKGELE